MKRAIWMMASLALLGAMSGCGMQVNAAENQPTTAEIVLITDGGVAEDSPVSQAVWSGIQAYGQETGRSYLHVKAMEPKRGARLCALQSGMGSEVRLVVCVGASYESIVFEAQKAYPDVMFLLLDGEPCSEDTEVYETTANTHCILYQETQAGFLAGYAAVMEGNDSLGFCGGSASPAVIRYGYGFVQGADFAAKRLDLDAGEVKLRYWYARREQQAQEVADKMRDWYQTGTQLVFVCDGGNPQMTEAVISATEKTEGKLVGADASRAKQSKRVVCSAVKGFTQSVEYAMASLDANEGCWDALHAGQTAVLGVEQEGIGLSEPRSWRLSKLSYQEYEEILELLKQGDISLDESSNRELFPVVSLCSITDEGEG